MMKPHLSSLIILPVGITLAVSRRAHTLVGVAATVSRRDMSSVAVTVSGSAWVGQALTREMTLLCGEEAEHDIDSAMVSLLYRCIQCFTTRAFN